MQRTFILSISVIVVSALTLVARAGTDATVEQNKAKVRQFYDEVFNTGKVELADQFITADAIDHQVMPGQKDPVPALANFKQFLTEFRAAFPDLKVQVEDVIGEGDKVMVRARMTGTQKGDFMGVPASGKSFSIEIVDIIRLTDGKLVEHWGLTDDLGMMQQLGLMPAAK